MEIIEKVKALNAKATNLNKKREKALWERNKAKEELAKAIADYKEKYGVELTEEKIAEEYNTVLADITAKAEKLEKDIQTIENGGSISNGETKSEGTVSVESNDETLTTNTSYDKYNTNSGNTANGGTDVNGASGFNPYMTGGVKSYINGDIGISGANDKATVVGGSGTSNNATVNNSKTAVTNPQPQNSGYSTFEEWQARMLGFDKKSEAENKEENNGSFNSQFDFRKYIE